MARVALVRAAPGESAVPSRESLMNQAMLLPPTLPATNVPLWTLRGKRESEPSNGQLPIMDYAQRALPRLKRIGSSRYSRE